MATVDLNDVRFWAPPSNPLLHKQRTALLRSNSRSVCASSSQNQPAPLNNKADRMFKCNDQSKSAITAARHQGGDFAAGAQGTISRIPRNTSVHRSLLDNRGQVDICGGRRSSERCRINCWKPCSAARLTSCTDVPDVRPTIFCKQLI